MTSIIDLRSNDIRTRAQVIIEIPALDTREDWWDAYISAVEKKTGFRWVKDDSEYGVFSDGSGTLYVAYINPVLSDKEQWTVELEVF